MMNTILGAPASPYVRKVMLAHQLKDVVFDIKVVTPGNDNERFREASPLGKIPAYVTEKGTPFADSSVIIAYLERAYPQKPLYPADNELFARALWFEEYSDTQMSEATSALYFQRVIGPTFFNHQTDEERVEEILTKLIPPVLDYLESQLSEPHYFIGDSVTVADVAIGSNLMSLARAGYDINSANWPKLAAYFEHFLTIDAVKSQKAAEDKMFSGG